MASLAAVAIAAAMLASSVADATPFFAVADTVEDRPVAVVVVIVDVGVGIGSGILLPYGDCIDLFWFEAADNICDEEFFPDVPACPFALVVPIGGRAAPTECEIPFPTGRFCECKEE